MQFANDHKVISLTAYAARRAARRNLVPDAIEYVLTYGRRIQRTGVTFYFLGHRGLPAADRQASWIRRLEGAVVLLSNEGQIITIYRQRNALSSIRRKAKYRLDISNTETNYRKCPYHSAPAPNCLNW